MTFTKDPDAVLDYSCDWTAWLEADTITSVTWVTRAPLIVENQSHTAKIATVWLKGGEARKSYSVTCRITTAGGRTDDRSFSVEVNHK